MKAKNLSEDSRLCAVAQDRDEREQEDRRGRAVGHHRRGAVQMNAKRLRIGFIPLCDATALIVAVDKGFAAAEGLDVELVREVSWSNVRDKLNIGLFDAAHLIAPVAIASSLGLGHIKVPIVGAVRSRRERQCHHRIAGTLCGACRNGRRQHRRSDGVRPRARPRGGEPQGEGAGPAHLRHDVPVLDAQLSSAVLDGGRRRRSGRRRAPGRAAAALHGRKPANKHVDGFCVGAPWNSVAVDLGIGYILHFVSEILSASRGEGARGARKLGRPKIPTCCGG